MGRDDALRLRLLLLLLQAQPCRPRLRAIGALSIGSRVQFGTGSGGWSARGGGGPSD